MPDMNEFDVVVIGAGPGGYVAAIRAAQEGLHTAVVERDRLGGVCLNVGCIPSKSLIHHADQFRAIPGLENMGLTVDRSGFSYDSVFADSRDTAETLSKGVGYLLKKNGVETISGTAQLRGDGRIAVDGDREIVARNTIIATGSRPLELPTFPFDEQHVLSSTGALMLQQLPTRAAIIGSGYIGMEFAHIWNAFGVDVHVIELLDNVLPAEDCESVAILRSEFESRGVAFYTATRAESMDKRDDGIRIALRDGKGVASELQVDTALVAVGRLPNSSGLGLESADIAVDERGFITTGDFYETTATDIYAIGDVAGPPLLAHAASREAEIAVNHIAGEHTLARIDLNAVPCAIYCEPQLARFGRSEEQLRTDGVKYTKAVFPFRGIGKAVAVGRTEGQVKLLSDPDTGELLGAHIVGPEATELIHELLLAKSSELLPEDISAMIHAHPTLSEALKEAADAAFGQAVHI